MNEEHQTELPQDAARIYSAILGILANRKSRASAITNQLIMRQARFGLKGVEEAQRTLHTLGLVDIELQDWNEADPMLSRYRYSLPHSIN